MEQNLAETETSVDRSLREKYDMNTSEQEKKRSYS